MCLWWLVQGFILEKIMRLPGDHWTFILVSVQDSDIDLLCFPVVCLDINLCFYTEFISFYGMSKDDLSEVFWGKGIHLKRYWFPGVCIGLYGEYLFPQLMTSVFHHTFIPPFLSKQCRSSKESADHEDAQQAGASLLWRWDERVGLVAPAEEKALGRMLSTFRCLKGQERLSTNMSSDKE